MHPKQSNGQVQGGLPQLGAQFGPKEGVEHGQWLKYVEIQIINT
jgi:hypothetical protein